MQYKIIHFSVSDISGGSAFYAYRLHKHLEKTKKISSKMFVLKKNTNEKNIESLDYDPNSKYLKYLYFFFLKGRNRYSFYNYGKYVIQKYSQVSKIVAEKPNAVIIYNNSNFIHPKILNYLSAKKIKLFFYLMDMELITGGCHYNFECNGYKKNCSSCPAVKIPFRNMPSKNFYEKKENLYKANITFFSPTKKIYKDILHSGLFNKKKHKNYLLNLGLDLKLYKPASIKKKRNKILISFRSSLNPRKGNQFLIEALEYAYAKDISLNKRIKFNILGDSTILEFLNKNKFEYEFSNSTKNEKELINFYHKSDFFLTQSKQDVGPVMVNEALACGVPILSFKIGISREVIKNNFNGYLLNDFSIKKFGDKILEISNIKKKLLIKMKKNSRKSAFQNFDINKKTNKILNLIK